MHTLARQIASHRSPLRPFARALSRHPGEGRDPAPDRKSPLLTALALPLTLAACAAPTQYMGLSLTSPATPENVRTLASRAMTGDKQAQLDLGIAFEHGQGVPQDWKRAKKLYRMAATTSGGTIWVYVPGTRTGEKGSVMPMVLGPIQQGLIEAKQRLIKGTGKNL